MSDIRVMEIHEVIIVSQDNGVYSFNLEYVLAGEHQVFHSVNTYDTAFKAFDAAAAVVRAMATVERHF